MVSHTSQSRDLFLESEGNSHLTKKTNTKNCSYLNKTNAFKSIYLPQGCFNLSYYLFKNIVQRSVESKLVFKHNRMEKSVAISVMEYRALGLKNKKKKKEEKPARKNTARNIR